MEKANCWFERGQTSGQRGDNFGPEVYGNAKSNLKEVKIRVGEGQLPVRTRSTSRHKKVNCGAGGGQDVVNFESE